MNIAFIYECRNLGMNERKNLNIATNELKISSLYLLYKRCLTIGCGGSSPSSRNPPPRVKTSRPSPANTPRKYPPSTQAFGRASLSSQTPTTKSRSPGPQRPRTPQKAKTFSTPKITTPPRTQSQAQFHPAMMSKSIILRPASGLR